MKTHKERFEILDGLRGLAALYVVFHHARLVCWESYYTGYLKHPDLYNHFDKACLYFFSIFKYGSEAVTLFFVLSGLVIHYKQAHSIQGSDNFKFNLAGYIKNRVRRIFPPLIFCMLLMVILALTSMFFFRLPYPDNLSVKTIVANLTFITTPFFYVAGNNFPLWSLRVEWWIYMVYPLLLLINRKKIYLGYILVLAASLILYYLNFNRQYFWIETFLYLPTWCIGAYIADVLSERIKFFKLLNILLILLPISLILQGKYNDYISDFGFGIGLLPVFIFLLSDNKSLIKNAINSLIGRFRFFSGFSYTLYIIHFPIQAFLTSIYLRYYDQLPHSFYLAFLGVFASVLVAYLSHFYTEKKFIVRRN